MLEKNSRFLDLQDPNLQNHPDFIVTRLLDVPVVPIGNQWTEAQTLHREIGNEGAVFQAPGGVASVYMK